MPMLQNLCIFLFLNMVTEKIVMIDRYSFFLHTIIVNNYRKISSVQNYFLAYKNLLVCTCIQSNKKFAA